MILPLYQIITTAPSPVHSLSLATFANRRALQGDAPDLKLLLRHHPPPHQHPSLLVPRARGFGVRTAWNIGGDVRRSLATHHLHSIFKFPSSENEGEDDDIASHRHSSNIERAVKRLSVMSRSTLKYAQPFIKSGRQGSTAMRTPALVAMGAKSTLLLTS